jgi:hypothetical protein
MSIAKIPASEADFEAWFLEACGPCPSIHSLSELRERYGEAKQRADKLERELSATAEWYRRYTASLSAFRLGAGEKVDKRIKHGS